MTVKNNVKNPRPMPLYKPSCPANLEAASCLLVPPLAVAPKRQNAKSPNRQNPTTPKEQPMNHILSAAEIRAILAQRKISKRQLSDETGISYQYLVEVLQGYRPATKMRQKITDYLLKEGSA